MSICIKCKKPIAKEEFFINSIYYNAITLFKKGTQHIDCQMRLIK